MAESVGLLDQARRGYGVLNVLQSFLCLMVTQIAIFLFTVLGLVGVIKIVQANIDRKNTIKLVQDEQHQRSQQQVSVKSLTQIMQKLCKQRQTFLIQISLYKQFLYMKTRAYHGTHMTSVLASLKKQNERDLSSSFEDRQLNELRRQIIQQVGNSISTLQKAAKLLEDRKLTVIQRDTNFKVSDLLKYNLACRQKFSQLKDKVQEVSERWEDLKKKSDDQQFVQLTKKSLDLIGEFEPFLKNVRHSLLKDRLKHELENQLNQCEKEQEFQSILKLVCKPDTVEQNHRNDDDHSQASTKISMLIEQFVKNKNFSFNHENSLEFLGREISDLTKISEQIKTHKSTFQKEPTSKDTQSSIKIYSTADHQSTKQNETSKTKHQQPTIQQSQTAFSSQNKLSFIKQLDKLMVRNRIRKELEEMEEKMKYQESLEVQQSEEDSNVVLQKI